MASENCSVCGKPLRLLFTSLKKYNGKKVCSSCATKIIKQEFKDDLIKINERSKVRQEKMDKFTNGVSEKIDKAFNVSKDGKCPKCGSDNIKAISESTGGGYGIGKGLCGGILLGPFGLLCGLCGSKSKSTAKRMCINCGNKF